MLLCLPCCDDGMSSSTTTYSIAPAANASKTGIAPALSLRNSIVATAANGSTSPDSAPIKRIIQDAKDAGRVIDASCGRKTRAVIITDSDHVILSALQAETVANRLSSDDVIDDEDEE